MSNNPMRNLAPLFESAEQLRERAASLRWVAEGMQDMIRSHDLRQFADQLEYEAIKRANAKRQCPWCHNVFAALPDVTELRCPSCINLDQRFTVV